ncbi:MAG: RNA polymerase sigma factor [Proteobacteria bacterium]|nr:RNA polymerase sigma factor [Pseudomonadota bacterium]MBU1739501.1 RNA polymerase sigma factor [Pseudomonadota bacterium]
MNMIREDCRESEIETILRPHLPYLHRLAFRLTGQSHDAEDLLHDVLVKVFSRQHRIGGIEHLRAWLSSVLYRTFLDRVRREKRSILRLFRPATDDNSISEMDTVPSSLPGPEKSLQISQEKDAVLTALGKLSIDQKIVCIMHDMEGYTLNELEDILDIPLGTLKSRLHRARKSLRGFLEKNGTFQPRHSFHE